MPTRADEMPRRARRVASAALLAIAVFSAHPAVAGRSGGSGDFKFDGTISRAVLENYLARSVTAMDLCTGKGDVDDNIRMLRNIGAKFAGRTVYQWGYERDLTRNLARAKKIAARIHAVIPDMVLQAGIFEYVSSQVNDVAIPPHVLKEFGLPLESRNYRQDSMLFADGRHRWGGGGAPDVTRIETRLWFYHLATAYIDIGMEALHLGQIHLTGKDDKEFANWWDLVRRIRTYAAKHARRHMVICDAHTNGIVSGGRLLLDFHSCPLCVKEVAGRPQEGILEIGHGPYRMSKGGVTPSGWKCNKLPNLVELDNAAASGRGGQAGVGWGWVWGYDEIDWFARQSLEYRNTWLRYAHKWVRDNDPSCFLQMPVSRILHDPADGKRGWYHANSTKYFAAGFDQEETIKSIWGPLPAVAERERKKLTFGAGPGGAAVTGQKPKATEDATAFWNYMLIERVTEALNGGAEPRFFASSLRRQVTVTGAVDESSLKVQAGTAAAPLELNMPLERLSAGDKKSLALAVLRDGTSSDHCLAGFFLLANGESAEAEQHLRRASPEDATTVREGFTKETTATPAK